MEGEEGKDRAESKPATLRTPICEFGGHCGAISAAEWLAGADQVITASWDRLAMLHDVETGSLLIQLSGKWLIWCV